jgi:hypothetical protein
LLNGYPCGSESAITTLSIVQAVNHAEFCAYRFGEYDIENGAFVQFKMMRIEGSSDRAENSFPLCDFTCRIVEEVIADDGLTDTSFLRLEGRRADGAPLPLVDIPAKSFYAKRCLYLFDFFGVLFFIANAFAASTAVNDG